MPKVPTYDSPQVETRALPGFRQSSVASPSLFGAAAEQQIAAGKGMLAAGTGLANAAAAMQDRENADMLFREETVLKDKWLAFEDDVNNNRRGMGAWNVTEDTKKFFADAEKEAAERLTNDVQRKLFNRSVTRLRQTALGAMSRYEAGERLKSSEEAERASIVGSISIAARAAARGFVGYEKWEEPAPPKTKTEIGSGVQTFPAGAKPAPGLNVETTNADGTTTYTPGENQPDPTKDVTELDTVTVTAKRPRHDGGVGFLNDIKQDIIKRVDIIAKINRWGPSVRDAEVEKHLTNLHKQIIQNLAGNSPSKAKEYFEANKEEIAGTEYEGITGFLKTTGLRETAQTFADEVMGSKMSEAEALAAARAKFSGDEETAVINEIKVRYNELDVAKKEAMTRALDPVNKVLGDAMVAGRSIDVRKHKAMLNALAATDPKAYAEAARRIDAWNDEVRAEAKAAAGGAGGAGMTPKQRAQMERWLQLRDMATQNPKAFLAHDLMGDIGVLGESEIKDLQRIKEDLRKPDGQYKESTLVRQITTSLDGAEIKDKAERAAAERAIREELRALESAGKPVDEAARQKVIDRLLIKGDVNGRWPGGGRRAYEVRGTADAAKFKPDKPVRATELADVPKADQDLIREAARKKGVVPTSQEIVRRYNQLHGF